MRLASIGGWTVPLPDYVYYPAVVVVALAATYVIARVVSRFVGEKLRERHIRIGDRITFDSQSGIVTDVRLRVTLIKSDTGDLIVVPNSELFTKPVTVHAPDRATEAKPTPPA